MQREGEMFGFEQMRQKIGAHFGFGLMKRITTKMVLLTLMASVVVFSSDRVVVVAANEDSITRKMRINLEVDRKLKLLNKPAIKSIQSEDGDIIDCVDLYKQPAFDHPALKNHIIQMEPTYDPTMEEEDTASNKYDPPEDLVSQLWKRSGSCPKGTIPIRRIRRKDLLRTNSQESYGRKNPRFVHVPNKTENKDVNHVTYNSSRRNDQNGDIQFHPANHSMAAVFTEGMSYSGAKADISIWNPYVESDDEFSTAQIWLKNGFYYDFESIESGWIVNPGVYGDRRTRLFAYWTTDASMNTGCFDLTCPGFVQTSTEIAIGSTIDPVSAYGGAQYQMTLFIFKDPNTSNWWLQYGNINVGYWPPEIFSALRVHASFVEWGGEVYSTKIGNKAPPHTSTQMGSGEGFALYGYTCFVHHIRIKDNSPFLKYPRWVYTFTDEYNCYEIFRWAEDYFSEPMFYFGGSGRNPRCP